MIVRRSVMAGTIALAVLAAAVMTPGTAAAEGTIILPVEGLSAPIEIDASNYVVYPAATGGTQAAPQCVSVPGTPLGNICMGVSTTPAGPVSQDLFGLVKHNNKARDALNWIVAEGKESVRALYDVPADQRIEDYARSELRAHMVERLLDIMDRHVYDLPLSEDEQAALDFVVGEYIKDDLTLSQAAWDEFEEWQNLNCAYRPPAKPASVAEAVPLPKKVRDWCSVAHHPTSEAFMFAPPMPSVDEFTAWGAYAAKQELGLDVIADERVADLARDATLGLVALGGMGLALGAAGVTAAVVGSTAALSSLVVGLIGSHAAATTFVGGAAPGGVIAGSTAGVGAAAAAAVVAVVVVFVIVTAVSIWLLVQNESIGKTLKTRLDDARAETDPFGFGELRDDLAGKPLRSEYDPAKPPSYRTGAAIAKLMAKVVLWTSVEQPPALASSARVTTAQSAQAATLPPTIVEDPDGLWTGNATKPTDFKFQTRTGAGDWVTSESITVPQTPGPATVRFSRGWMITDTSVEPPEGNLSFGYLNENGKPRLAVRAPASIGGFIVSDPAGPDGMDGEHVMSITYRNESNVLVRARLKPRPYRYLEGPRPSAVGPLLAGRPVILRPNPVNVDGSSYDLADAETDFTYQWSVRRFNSDTGQWNLTYGSSAFGPSFTPSVTGLYDARVVMTSVEDPLVKKYGFVAFTIAAPPMAVEPMALLDNGSTQLELDLKVTEPVPGDTVTVDVTWPGDFGATEDPTQQVVMDCVQTDPLECQTPRTSVLNNLIFPLTQTTDLRRPVTVTLTNSYGAVVSQQFFIDSPIRPEVLPPPAGSNSGMPGKVTVGEDSTQVSAPLLLAGNSSYLVGVLDPGEAGGPDFGMFDPLTNNTTANIPVPGMEQVFVKLYENDSGIWELWVEGIVHPKDLGTYEVPVVLQQTGDLSRTAIVIVIHVVPSARDRYRAGMQSPVDPDSFAVATLPDLRPVILGGRSEWASYAGQMCVSLKYNGPTPAPTKCAQASTFFKPDGSAYRFPYAELYPTGMSSGGYQARAWLTSTSSRVDTTPLETSFLLTADATYPKPVVTIGAVTIDGTPKVGNSLRAMVASLNPSDAAVTYRWLRDGVVMPAYTARTYTVRAADVGHRLAVRVTATKQDWVTDTRTSPPTALATN